MLSGNVIHFVNINTFEELSTLDFIAGSGEELYIRLKQPHSDLRYIPSALATLEFHLPKKDGTFLVKVGSVLSDDRSIWHTALTTTDTKDLAGGNIWFKLTDGSDVIGGYIANGLSLVVTGGC